VSIRFEELPGAEAVAVRAAALIADAGRAAIAARGRFTLAISGGASPLAMFERLAAAALPWSRVHVFQVDERAAPPEDDARNWKQVRALWLDRVPLPPANAHPMPVEAADLEAAAADYATTLVRHCGSPPVLDMAQLGLGADGHTASLVPGDPVLDVADRDVATTRPYQGHRRMTLTLPMLARARQVLWLVTGVGKREALARLRAGDRTLPAARVASAVQLALVA
jgi:6-phosphogluconolactonase